MENKNYIVISNANHGGEYVRDTFNEDYSTSEYEVIDIDLVSTHISKKMTKKLNKKDAIWDRELDSAIYMGVDDYLDKIRNKLLEKTGEKTYKNIKCEILNYKGDE